jgi:hypothetical protein
MLSSRLLLQLREVARDPSGAQAISESTNGSFESPRGGWNLQWWSRISSTQFTPLHGRQDEEGRSCYDGALGSESGGATRLSETPHV